jgi:hypothetical protein
MHNTDAALLQCAALGFCAALVLILSCCSALLVLCVQANGQDKCELPVPLIRSAHQHLVAAREEAARTAKELAELKASRVQHIPPSTWIKREQKYKMDQEKYEHTIGQLRQRSEALERELAVLREGSNVRPLEEKIQVAGAVGHRAAVQAGTAADSHCAGAWLQDALLGRVATTAACPNTMCFSCSTGTLMLRCLCFPAGA